MAYSSARLRLDEREVELPIVASSDGSQAIVIEDLYEKTGIRTYDPNLENTSYVKSAISWIDAENGILLYRGYNVEDLVKYSSFVETSYLLTYGELPNPDQHRKYSAAFSRHSMIHEDMRNIFDAFPAKAHPLAILSTMVTALSSYYPQTYEDNITKGIDIGTGLLSKVRTLAAWAYRKSEGLPIIYPRDNLPYWRNFLNMMFGMPDEPYLCPPEDEKILNQLGILYSEHEQNVATSAVRLVGSARANLFACVVTGMSAMWGARESGANIAPMMMVDDMLNHNLKPEEYFKKFIKGYEPLRSNGLGHPGYKGWDPRAVISREMFHEYRKSHPQAANSETIKKALEIEEFVLGHPFFLEMNLYPNLDFYSAMLFHLIGIPASMNNVIRVIGKLSGWLAHWHEQRNMARGPAYRPAQIYTGQMTRDYVPLEKRDS
jgi:citrate synthase